MNTHYAYKNVLTRHQNPRMIMRPRTSMLRKRRQAIIGAGISVFIVTLGFVITLNVTDTKQIKAAVHNSIAAVETNAVLNAEMFSLAYDSPSEQTVEISLMAEDGSDIINTTQKAVGGMNYFEQKLTTANGIYFVKLKSSDQEQIIKIVKE
jgi:hypothetical protein